MNTDKLKKDKNIKKIIDKIQENEEKRKSCDFHNFIKNPNKDQKYSKPFICNKCGYECDRGYFLGYQDCISHVRKLNNISGGLFNNVFYGE